MTERFEYGLESLREVADFTVYRGQRRDNQSPILAIAPGADQPSPQSVRRLEQWEMDRIRAKGHTDSVVDPMVGKLKRLSDTTQDALMQLACLGNVVEVAILSLVQGKSEVKIHTTLWEATRSIVESQGGFLWASANLPRGAAFYFTLSANTLVSQ